MKLTRTAGFLLVALLVLGAAGSAPGQTQVAGMNVEGSVEAGARGYLTDGPKNKERAKFEEYRDMGAGGFLERLQLRLSTSDDGYLAGIEGSKWGREDQEFSLSAGRTGLWQFQFDWDQLPHLFSTTSRTLEHEVSRGVWAAPTINSLTDFNGQATSRELHDVSVRWDTARLHFKLTPTPDLDLTADYTRIRKEGNKPFGMSFGTPGSNFLELLQPIEETVHDFRLGLTLARETWQIQAGYTLSVYDNDLTRMRFDNPCAQAPATAVPGTSAAQIRYGCSGNSATTGGPGESPWGLVGLNPVSRTGQSSLPPSNMAHIFNLAGGVSLPLRTRITGSVTYSFAFQNADFLPHTINPSLAGDPDLVLPQKSLNGNVQTLNLNFQATSRPLPLPLTLSAKYRLYDLHDLSDNITFPGTVISDRASIIGTPAIVGGVATCPGCKLGDAGAEEALRQSFTRHNADFDARYQIVQPVAATVGFGWERWNRGSEREVLESDEYFVKAAIDTTPFDWLLARLTYKPSFRRDDDYSRTVNPSNGFLFRKVDEAERNRQRVDLLLQLMPLDTLWVTPTAGYRYDDYLRSAFGLLWETSWSAGIDFGWNPSERLSFSAGYVHEVDDRDLKNRGASFNLASSINADWTTSMKDTVDTFHVEGKAGLIPKTLDWTFGANYSTSSGTRETRLSSATLPGPALAVPGLLPKRMPAADDELIMFTTALRYHFSKSWAASLFYTFERFRKHDWRTDDLTPFIPQLAGTTGSIWLGNDQRNYDAHIAGVTFAYTFK